MHGETVKYKGILLIMKIFLILKQVVHVFSRHRAFVLLANICVLVEHNVTSYILDFLVLLSGS
jgi:hypothetical protein